MKKPLLLALIAAATLAPFAASAADAYVGASLGRGKTKVDISSAYSTKDTSTAYKVFGGYQFNESFGLEGGYVDLDKTVLARSGVQVAVNPRSYYFAGTASLPLSAEVKLYAKLGAVRTHSKLSFNGNSASGNRTSALLGVGASWAVSKQVSLVIEYEDYGKLYSEYSGGLTPQLNGDSTIKGSMLSLGVRFHF